MKFSIIAVGKSRAGPERDLLTQYIKRLNFPVDVIEVEEKKPFNTAQLKAREATLLLEKVPNGATIIALDEHGKSLSSRDIAGRIQGWQDQGVPALAFLIGGADGHGDAVLQAAQLKLSLGTMTWPHMLVRALVAEQIYRADCINRGHPYHRD